jgi:F0F1-type ATP synthase assembly protein I
LSDFRSHTDRKIIAAQLVLALLISTALLTGFGVVEAYSALAGGMISVAANVFLALRLFDGRVSWDSAGLTASVYRGVIGRILLTLALFALTLALIRPLDAVVFFAAYLLVQVSPAVIVSFIK